MKESSQEYVEWPYFLVIYVLAITRKSIASVKWQQHAQPTICAQ
jgi:hypothetical protein